MARNQQLKVLQALDVARTQLYHFTAIVIAGMGFFTDAYDLFSISLVVDLIGYRYYPGSMAPTRVEAAIRVIALCGTVPGQLVFGWLGDNMGRKRIYGVTLLLMVFCSLASGFSFSKHTPESVVTVLCLFRFLLGVGIGGDYPLSATIMSEYANKRTRGGFMAAVFAMQGFGILAAGLVGIITSKAFEHSSRENTDYVWRIVLMFGAIPALLTYYWRMKMPETARYTALVTKDEKKAVLDMSTVLNMDIAQHEEENVEELPSMRYQYGLFSAEFLHHHGLHLLGTSITWFLVDITFYSLNMCMKQMFSTVMIVPELGATCNPLAEDCPMASPEPGYYQVDPPTQLEQMIKITGLHTVIALLGTLPGYFFTVAFIDRFGRVKIQLFGFTMMTLFVLCLAIPYDQWVKRKNRIVFAIMYAFTFFFANFGPNTTTFIVSAELFPARLRSTCHGISGAAGKIGAILGVLAFSFMKAKRYQLLLFVLVGCNLVGILFTLLLPETKGKSLEEITGETEEGQPLDDEAAVANTMDDIHTVHVTGGLCGEVV